MIEIGKIVKPQGIKGEVKIISEREPQTYQNLSTVIVDGKDFEVETLSCRDALYVKLKGISTRNDAELLRGKTCYASEEELENLKENEFYFNDLIGSKVVSEDGSEIGKIEDIEQYGAADVIIIRERNLLFSVPFLNSIFKEVERGKVVVCLEEYDDLKINY